MENQCFKITNFMPDQPLQFDVFMTAVMESYKQVQTWSLEAVHVKFSEVP